MDGELAGWTPQDDTDYQREFGDGLPCGRPVCIDRTDVTCWECEKLTEMLDDTKALLLIEREIHQRALTESGKTVERLFWMTVVEVTVAMITGAWCVVRMMAE